MRTLAATESANGAWYVVEADTSSTDCVASASGPILFDQGMSIASIRHGHNRRERVRRGRREDRFGERKGTHRLAASPTSSQDHHSLAVCPTPPSPS